MKPNWDKMPSLAKAWDEYGHSVERKDLFDMKVGTNGCYVALAWRTGDGFVDYADLATGDRGMTWEMQNDGHEPIEEKVWLRMKPAPECDWLVDPKED